MNRTSQCVVCILFALFSFSGALAQTSTSLVATGSQQFGSFGGGPFDVVNLGNLNVHFAFPVLHKAGRGTPFIHDFNYDSSIWTPIGTAGSQNWQPLVGMGWNGQLGINQFPQAGNLIVHSTVSHQQPCNPPFDMTLVTINVYSGWTWTDPSGITHGFPVQTSDYSGGCQGISGQPPTTATAMASDGSPYQLNASYNSGTILSVANNSIYSPGSGSSVQDRNGNKITFGSIGATDTLGQGVITAAGGAPNPLTFTYSAPGGSAHVTVTFKSYSVITAFHCSGIQDFNQAGWYLVDKIRLADNTFYQFGYEQTPGDSNNNHVTGRISSVTLPTGGTITYGYNYSDGNNGIVCSDGSTDGLTRTLNGGTWTYTRLLNADISTHWTTTVTTPTDSQNSPAAGNDTVIDFEKDCTTNSNNFYETARTTYQGPKTSNNPLLTTLTSYQASSCGSAQVNAPITTRTVTLQYPNGLQAKTTTDYNSTTGVVNDIYQSAYGSGAPGAWARITQFQYYYAGSTPFPSSVIVSDGSFGTLSKTTYAYDEYSTYPLQATTGTPQHVSVTNSNRGNPTTITTYATGSATLVRHFSYYDTGNVYKAYDVNGAITTYNYDTTVQGNSTKSCGNSFPTSYTLPIAGLSSAASTTWNCIGGVATTVTDLNGNSTVSTYSDPYFWRPASVQDPTTATTSFTYTPYTSSTSLASVDSRMVFNSNASVVEALTTIGQYGQTLYSQQREGPSSTSWDSTQVLYDSFLRAFQSTMPCVANAGVGCPSAAKTTSTFDALNRVTKTTDGGGGYLQRAYAQNDILQTVGPQVTNENLKKKQLEYDAIGRLTSVCEITALSGSGTCSQTSPQTGYYTTYAYGLSPSPNFYLMVTVTQNAQATSGHQTRVYMYDYLGRMISEQNPENGTTNYTYDNDTAGTCSGTYNGDLVKVIDAKGNKICYQYDVLHRVTSITYPSGPDSANTPSKTFVYDSATFNGTAMANPKGRMVEAYTGSSSSKKTDEFFSHSKRGEKTDVWECTPHSGTNGCAAVGNYYHVAATFWANGAFNTLTSSISGLPSQTYAPDPMGRVKSVTAGSGTNPVTSTSYDLTSYTYKVTFGSGDIDQLNLDPNTGRVTQYVFNMSTYSDTGKLTWNPNGSMAGFQIIDTIPSTTDTQNCSYSHDDLSRIASVDCLNGPTKIWNQAFTYDAFGNISKSSTGPGNTFLATYSSSTNWITLAGFSYDSNGQITADGTNSYAWDVGGSMIALNTTSLTYDALGRMVEKSSGSSNTEFVLGVHGEQFATMTGQTLQKAFIPLPASVAVYTPSGLAYYRHSDHLGSVRLETTPSKTLYSSTDYAPFGETYASVGAADFSFTGQDQDTLSGTISGVQGMYDFMFRKHSPVQGRWMSPDPAGVASANPANPQSWNRYAYVLGSPMSLIDPLGLDCVYLYDDASGVEAIDPGSCDPGSGGFYIPGTVDPNSILIDSNNDTIGALSVVGDVVEWTASYSGQFGIASQTLIVDTISNPQNNAGPLYPPSMFNGTNNIPIVSQWRPPTQFVNAPYKPLPYKPSVAECFTNPGNAVELMAESNETPLNPEEHDPAAPVLVYQQTNRGIRSVNSEEGESAGAGLAILTAGASNWVGCMAGALFGN